MSDLLNGKPAMSFWVVGAAALIWNLFGLVVYVMQVSATPEELAAAYSPEQVEFMLSTPKWATSAFAIAVTTGVMGCFLLLLRKAWALPMFVISLVGVLIQNLNTFVLNDAIAVFGSTPAIIQSVIVVIAIALVWYTRTARSKGWIA
ncbi:MAG: hypothetical protein OEU90_14160 [Gammaproteobacteria bacterium]|jgi:hypothetical protein|nr:hypothetical protein [Gammaproteobacteria bacterium]MDH3749927.1 hypothetical protein [Gammaproteobacteria bacterium]MDH3806599.1 hypothetical protein [Gammaproteobacteria bacterium]